MNYHLFVPIARAPARLPIDLPVTLYLDTRINALISVPVHVVFHHGIPQVTQAIEILSISGVFLGRTADNNLIVLSDNDPVYKPTVTHAD